MATTTATTSRNAGRAVWVFDRACRMTALCERVEDELEYLARERCDCYGDTPRRRVIDRRLHLLRERLNRFRVRARNLRRAARTFQAHETDAE